MISLNPITGIFRLKQIERRKRKKNRSSIANFYTIYIYNKGINAARFISSEALIIIFKDV